MRHAVFARHGESVFSAAGLLNGDETVPGPLTDEGREQARRLGAELAGCPLDLCVTSRLERTIETAREAFAGRDLPAIALADLNDPRYGAFEGGPLQGYRAWAADASSSQAPPGGGESRYAIVARYAAALAVLLGRPERSLAVVAHSLPVAYVLAAAQGTPPRPRMPLAAYATPYPFARSELTRALEVIERWLGAPDW